MSRARSSVATVARTVAWIVAWIAAASFGGCTCSKNTTVLAECGAPLPAELVKTSTTELGLQGAGGHGFFLLWPDVEAKSGLSLRIHTTPETVVPYEGQCARYELVPDPKGVRLAVRCSGKDAWDVIHVLRPGVAFPGAKATGAALAWDEVPTFDDAAGELLASYLRGTPKYAQRLIDEVRARRGDDGVANVLEVTIDAEPGGDPLARTFDPPHTLWTTTYEGLPPPKRARIDEKLDRALRDVGSSENAFRRALLLRDVDGGGFDDAIVARTEKDLATLSPKVFELVSACSARGARRTPAVSGVVRSPSVTTTRTAGARRPPSYGTPPSARSRGRAPRVLR